MKILITGAQGLLGSNLCTIYSDSHEVFATELTKPKFPDCENHILDITGNLNLITELKPDLVINCAAIVDVDYCEKNPDKAMEVNAKAVKNLSDACAKSHLIHISTDMVFDGETGNYSEDDVVNPLNIYSKSKLAGEEFVKGTVIRTNIYGWNMLDKMSLAEWMLAKFESGEGFSGFNDVYFSPILVNNLADACLELHSLNFKGILNVAGSNCTKFEFGQTLAKVFDLDQNLIKPASVDDMKFAARRPKNMTLNTDKAKSMLKTKLLDMESGLREFKKLRDSGYVKKLKCQK